jgi:alkaline phosphatase
MEDPDGFFLMIEGARIDHASHDHLREHMIFETMAFERTVAEISTDERIVEDTLFIVTADHGTGGLVIDVNNGQGEMPDVHWTTGYHTGEDVPFYAKGPGAEAFEAIIAAKDGVIDNTDIYPIITELITWETRGP